MIQRLFIREVDPTPSMSWRRIWVDISSVLSRHLHNEEIIRNEVHVQDESSWKDHILEACCPYGDHGYVKICLRRVSPIVSSMGEQFTIIHQASAIKKGIPYWGIKYRPHQDQVNDQGKNLFFIWFLSYQFRGVVRRPVYRTDSCTIKRSSRVSNMIIPFIEISNLFIIFLDFYLVPIYGRI
jgi:hypothetical protein